MFEDSCELDPRCAFCRIVTGEERADVVHRWTECLIISPLHPATLGHVLLIPASHVSTIWQLSVPLAKVLAERALEVAEVLRRETQLRGLNVIQSNGSAATQTVPHLHVHLVPRYNDDKMGAIWPEGSELDTSDTRRLLGRLSASRAWKEPPA